MIEKDGSNAVNTTTHLCRQHILEATAKCLDEWGYEATTVRRIATRLDCAVGSIYRYFHDKRELMDTLAQQLIQPVADLVEAGGSIEDVERLYHRRACSAPQLYHLMFWLAHADGDSSPGLPKVVRRVIDGWADQLGDHVQAQRRWALVHASVMFGATLSQMRLEASPVLHGVHGPVSNQPTAMSPPVSSASDSPTSDQGSAFPAPQLTPLPPGAPDHAAPLTLPASPPPLREAANESGEDICLL